MTTEQIDFMDEVSNPLDSVEDILAGQNWQFSRMTPDELMVDVSGRIGTYRMVFQWQEDFSAMQFTCHFDLIVPGMQRGVAAMALADINAGLWLGRFDLPSDTSVPCFRHTSLFRGQTQSSGAEHLQDLMDIALGECERYYALFQMLSEETHIDQSMIDLVLMDFGGEA